LHKKIYGLIHSLTNEAYFFEASRKRQGIPRKKRVEPDQIKTTGKLCLVFPILDQAELGQFQE
jgi:hypothetical protein